MLSIALHFNTNRNMAEDTLASLRGDNHLLLQADITEPALVQQMIETVTHRFGALDIVVNVNGASYLRH